MTLEFLHTTPVGPQAERLVALLLELLPGEQDYATVEHSVRNVFGVRVTPEVVDELSWRMAGNYRRLAERKVVPPWHVQRLPEWVPAQVVSCKREKSGRGKPGARLGFRVLAGTPAGRVAYKWWSLKLCRYVAPEFGYSVPRGARRLAYPYSAPEQLVGLRTYLCVTPSLSGREPGFEATTVHTSVGDWNRTTIRCRFRAQPKFVCLMKATPADLPCHVCPVGFARCRAGTHRADWVERHCEGCGKRAYFDPESTSPHCVACAQRAAYRA